MATSLQQQLAAIASHSTHQLDLKAQKSRHSKSLLFEPRDAATQSFDTIFQICYEGFEELCMVDARFSPFVRNLFSEQSKNEDRTQMTAKENADLDKVIESFLGLASGRLLLKPAMKAVEWLVRRFRVEEYNTEATLLTFLPYHTSHIFPTLMSILPDQLPPSFKFLHPYVAALQCPPRHALLSASINNTGFFSALSQYVLRVANAKQHSAALIGFWASMTAQAVNGMIDATRSGRESIRKQREQDILLRVLPILQSALSIKGVPELYLGSCMIMTILATKASLEDKTLNAMMEAVAGAWTEQTWDDGLTCLAVIAEEKQHTTQPRSVTKAIVGIERLETRFKVLAQRLRVNKLVLSTCLGTAQSAPSDKQQALMFYENVVGQELLSPPHLEYLVSTLLRQAQIEVSDADDTSRQNAILLLEGLSGQSETATILARVARQINVDLQQLSPQLRIQTARSDDEVSQEESAETMEIDLPDKQGSKESEELMIVLHELDQRQASCLDPANESIIGQHTRSRSVFALLSKVTGEEHAFTGGQRCTLLTLLTRSWIQNIATVAQSKAIEGAGNQIAELAQGSGLDFQGLTPYVIAALADPSARVRKSAASLCHAMRQSFGKSPKDVQRWAADSLYGASSREIRCLPQSDSYRFLTSVLIPNLEDCVLDGGHIARVVIDALQGATTPGARAPNAEQKQMKSSLRAELCTYLASHAAISPLLAVKVQLLEMLNRVGKTANDARKAVLLPFAKEWASESSRSIDERCAAQGVSSQRLNKAIISSLSHRSADELQLLKAVAAGEATAEPELAALASQHLRKLWTAMKPASQMTLVDFFLDLALENAGPGVSEAVQSEALESLRGLQMPTEILVHIVASLPSVSDLQDQPSSAKKQRFNKADATQQRKPDETKIKSAIKRITLVLEIVEGSKPEDHPQLSKGLFHLLGELHHYKTLLGSQLVYIQGLLMSCLLAVVNGLKESPNTDVDRSVIRADLIVECVRTTSSTQVHNTALLLMSSLASWAPELVLHSVMPLFTFMSTTLLRQSDDFSAHVTDQTVARIVPPLAASLRKKGRDLVSGAAELLLSFTAAFEHIPLHRRAGLFQHLVQTLGPDDSLFAVITMLIERYPTDSRVVPFASDLANSFPVSTQMNAFGKYLNLVFDALKPKRGLSDTILSLGEKDAQQIEMSIDSLLQGLSQMLTSSILRKRLGKEFNKDAATAGALQSAYSGLLDQTMLLARNLGSNIALEDSAEALLAALLGLTPTKDFIESSAKLMQTGSDETRQQVFHSLEARVSQAKRGDAVLQQTFIEVLPNCCIFLDSTQPVATRHAAITCIDQIVEKYGKKDRTAVLKAAEYVAGDAALGSEPASLRTISILCLASTVEVLQDDFISLLPQVFQRILDDLDTALTSNKTLDVQLHSAAFGFASAVLDHLPWMFSAQYLDRATKLAALSVGRQSTSGTISTTANDFCTLAAKKVNPPELFSALQRTWHDVVSMGRCESVHQQLKLLHQAIQYHSKATITRDAPTLFAILLEAFDLRRQLPEGDQRAETLALVDQIALDMTLKLNDATFRPFFIRLVDWTLATLPKSDAEGRTLRAISFYSFSHVLFEQLKSIVTSYASYILDIVAASLRTVSPSTESGRLLLQTVLQALASSFRHDQDDFWQAPAHFDAVAIPLLQQLEKAKVVNVTDHIIPTITEFAAAASSPDHLKAINTTIMSYMRHQEAMVRLAAVKSERSITDKLNFDWLALLPEMLPFISELQEDDDEDVERETLRWVKQIEDVTGESLEGMLQ